LHGVVFGILSLDPPEPRDREARLYRRVIRSAGTNPRLPCSPGMKIREENCNMFLLAVVTVFTVVIAASSSLVGPTDKAPVRYAERAEQARAADKPIVYVTDQPAVRVVGAPFVPNTNPRER
jgi:hypothetical protein